MVSSPILRSALRVVLAAAALATLGGCFSIPQRAWANGQAMTRSRAYSSVLGGNQSIQAHRALESSLDPLRLNYTELPYTPFKQWWY